MKLRRCTMQCAILHDRWLLQEQKSLETYSTVMTPHPQPSLIQWFKGSAPQRLPALRLP